MRTQPFFYSVAPRPDLRSFTYRRRCLKDGSLCLEQTDTLWCEGSDEARAILEWLNALGHEGQGPRINEWEYLLVE